MKDQDKSETSEEPEYQPIKVYVYQSENSSERSFQMEATNIGEYYARQNELHAQLQAMMSKRNTTADLTEWVPPTQEDCRAQTTQTLQELRERHLYRMKQPTSPASPTSAQVLSGDQVGINPNSQAPTFKFEEWRQNQISKILKTLGDEEGDDKSGSNNIV